jgi:hypothetical protein
VHLAGEPHGQRAAGDGGVEGGLVVGLAAAEVGAAVDQGDGGVGLRGEREGGLDRAVAAADHRGLLAGVLGGVGELVDHVGQLGAGDSEPAGRAAPADREDDAVGGGGARGGLDVEARAGGPARRDRGDLGVLDDRQLGALDDVVEQREEGLLAGAAELDLAQAGEVERGGHHDLLAGVALDRAAERALLVDGAAGAVEAGLQRRAEAGGAGADDGEVVDAVMASGGARGVEGGAGGLAALGEGVVDQADAGDLAGDEQAGDGGLEGGGDDGDLDGAVVAAEDELDGGDRAAAQAVGVADAGGRADQAGAAGDEGEDVLLGTGVDAGAGADAGVGVDAG